MPQFLHLRDTTDVNAFACASSTGGSTAWKFSLEGVCLLIALLAVTPLGCRGEHGEIGPLLFNGTKGLADCTPEKTSNLTVNGALIHDCVFNAIIRKCSGKELSHPVLVFRQCRGRICEINLSISATGCFLTSIGLNYTEGLENDMYKCGVLRSNMELFEAKKVTWVDSVPGSTRCALGVPPGTVIEQNLICIRGFARLRFTLMLGNLLSAHETRYGCEFNPRCNSILGIFGESLCYEEPGQTTGEQAAQLQNGTALTGLPTCFAGILLLAFWCLFIL